MGALPRRYTHGQLHSLELRRRAAETRRAILWWQLATTPKSKLAQACLDACARGCIASGSGEFDYLIQQLMRRRCPMSRGVGGADP